MLTFKLLLCFALALAPSLAAIDSPAAAAAASQRRKRDVLKFLADATHSQAEPAASQWGFADAMATVGKAFLYKLPTHVFKDSVKSYKVVESVKDKLPNWLEYDVTTSTLRGVPSLNDVNAHHYIEVTGLDAQGLPVPQQKDVFVVSVQENGIPSQHDVTRPDHWKADDLAAVKCNKSSSVTMATVIVDADLEALGGHERLCLLGGVCRHLGLPLSAARLLPLGHKPIYDSSALVAGPGDVTTPSQAGAYVEWSVGCGNVHAPHMHILQLLEASSANASMRDAVGHGVVGWHVTNNRPLGHRRVRRQVRYHPTPTPVISVAPPTGQPMVSVDMTQPDHRHRHGHGEHSRHRPVIEPTPTVKIPPASVDGSDRERPTLEPPEIDWEGSGGIFTSTVVVEPSPSSTGYTDKSTSQRHQRTEWLPTPPTEKPQITPAQKPSTTTETPIRKTTTTTTATPQPTTTSTTAEKTTTTTKRPTTTTTTTTEQPTTTTTRKTTRYEAIVPPYPTEPSNEVDDNEAPMLKNNVDRIVVRVGEVLKYKIPKDTFYDYEDGNTRKLKLFFMTVDGLTIPPNSWVQFQQHKQRIYGLPMPEDEGRHEFLIAAIDSGGKIARDAFEIEVVRRQNERKINHEFSIVLNYDYREFMMDVSNRVDVARRIAHLYGDRDTRHITVLDILQGSVVYKWANNSVPTEHCSVPDVQQLLQKLIVNRTLNPELVNALGKFKVIRASAAPRGNCRLTPDVVPTVDSETSRPIGGGEVEETITPQDNDLLITVIPAVLIGAILLIACCIACLLYRRRRKCKLSAEDKHTFENRGIPVILPYELDEKPDQVSRPLILEEEKPPLAPPAYRSGSTSMPSTPLSDHRDALDTTEDEEGELLSQPYRPPPPLTGSREGHRSSRPKAMQSAVRHPPPYVPP